MLCRNLTPLLTSPSSISRLCFFVMEGVYIQQGAREPQSTTPEGIMLFWGLKAGERPFPYGLLRDMPPPPLHPPTGSAFAPSTVPSWISSDTCMQVWKHQQTAQRQGRQKKRRGGGGWRPDGGGEAGGGGGFGSKPASGCLTAAVPYFPASNCNPPGQGAKRRRKDQFLDAGK
jgi:hypothetical protein